MRGRLLGLMAAAAVVLAGGLMLGSGVAHAQGLTQDKLDDRGWLCGAEAEPDLPPGHCVNPGTGNGPGQTVNVMVFEGSGDFEAAETVTVHPLAGERPCPHDDESPDGTWWNPGGPTPPQLQVCHHR